MREDTCGGGANYNFQLLTCKMSSIIPNGFNATMHLHTNSNFPSCLLASSFLFIVSTFLAWTGVHCTYSLHEVSLVYIGCILSVYLQVY